VVEDSHGTAIGRFLAYPRPFRGGVRVVAANLDGDGTDDLIVAPARGGRSLVEIVDGSSPSLTLPSGQLNPQAILASFYAFPASYEGGVFITTSDATGSGTPEIIVRALPGSRRPAEVIDVNALLHRPQRFRIPSNQLPLVSTSAARPHRLLGHPHLARPSRRI
jgi:hypothetical protein